MATYRKRRSSARSTGLTLIELLVVIAIVGVIAGLVIPAVASVRETSRRLSCVNHLKQIGLSVQNHEAANRVYVPPMPLRSDGLGGLRASPDAMSGYYELLPFLEQSTLYNAINLTANGFSRLTPASRENLTACHTRFTLLLCPSDSYASIGSQAGNSYRFNVNNSQPTGYRSMTIDYHIEGEFRAGAFVPDSFSRAADFADGLSNTVGFAERSVGSFPNNDFDRRRDYWGAGLVGIFGSQSDDGVYAVCRSLLSTPLDFTTRVGTRWAFAGNTDVWYNHVSTPNMEGGDCNLGNATTAEASYCDLCSLAARSFHSGGVNCLMMDGSVHFVRNGIALPVWRALGSRAGSELVAPF